jgi:thymidylate synthase
MKIIKAICAEDAWIQASKLVLAEGTDRGDLIEVLNGIIEIETYGQETIFNENFRKIFGDERIDYAKSVTFVKPTIGLDGSWSCNPIKPKWSDTYFGRIVNWQGKFNQLEHCLKILQQGIAVKRCEMIIYDPLIDAKNMYKQPCLLAIDLKPRDGKLYLTAFFRSQAVSKSGYADYTALVELCTWLAQQSNLEYGSVEIHATSLHIRRQNEELKKTKELLKVCGQL